MTQFLLAIFLTLIPLLIKFNTTSYCKLAIRILGLLLITSLLASCQIIGNKDLKLINDLSDLLEEASGITKFADSPYIFAINDSGNPNSVFQLDWNGAILKEIRIPNSSNKDWEDLAYDQSGNLYIGDFGNNANDRQDLCIYKISGIQSGVPTTTKINFVLEDQKQFPPTKKNRNFDIEAFIYLDNYFFIFTKNRKANFDGETKLYQVPALPGNQTAKLINSYKTCDDPKDCFITGAAINASGNKIVLLTFDKVYVLSNFKGSNLFNGDIKKIKLNHSSQKEGICFKNDSTLYIVDEQQKIHGGNLYELRLK